MSQSSKPRTSFLTPDRGFNFIKPALCTNWTKLGLWMFIIILAVSVNWCQSQKAAHCVNRNKMCSNEHFYTGGNCSKFFENYLCRAQKVVEQNCPKDEKFDMARANADHIFTHHPKTMTDAVDCLYSQAGLYFAVTLSPFMTEKCRKSTLLNCFSQLNVLPPKKEKQKRFCAIFTHWIYCLDNVVESQCLQKQNIEEKMIGLTDGLIRKSQMVQNYMRMEAKIMGSLLMDWRCFVNQTLKATMARYDVTKLSRFYNKKLLMKLERSTSRAAASCVATWWVVLALLGLACLLLKAP